MKIRNAWMHRRCVVLYEYCLCKIPHIPIHNRIYFIFAMALTCLWIFFPLLLFDANIHIHLASKHSKLLSMNILLSPTHSQSVAELLWPGMVLLSFVSLNKSWRCSSAHADRITFCLTETCSFEQKLATSEVESSKQQKTLPTKQFANAKLVLVRWPQRWARESEGWWNGLLVDDKPIFFVCLPLATNINITFFSFSSPIIFMAKRLFLISLSCPPCNTLGEAFALTAIMFTWEFGLLFSLPLPSFYAHHFFYHLFVIVSSLFCPFTQWPLDYASQFIPFYIYLFGFVFCVCVFCFQY